jgi:hypothetical protein
MISMKVLTSPTAPLGPKHLRNQRFGSSRILYINCERGFLLYFATIFALIFDDIWCRYWCWCWGGLLVCLLVGQSLTVQFSRPPLGHDLVSQSWYRWRDGRDDLHTFRRPVPGFLPTPSCRWSVRSTRSVSPVGCGLGCLESLGVWAAAVDGATHLSEEMPREESKCNSQFLKPCSSCPSAQNSTPIGRARDVLFLLGNGKIPRVGPAVEKGVWFPLSDPRPCPENCSQSVIAPGIRSDKITALGWSGDLPKSEAGGICRGTQLHQFLLSAPKIRIVRNKGPCLTRGTSEQTGEQERNAVIAAAVRRRSGARRGCRR